MRRKAINLSERHIRNVIRDVINEERNKSAIKRIIEEEVYNCFNSGRLYESEDSEEIKRKGVMKMLKDDKFNHAELMRKLWHPKDKKEEDTLRSLFSKCATGTPDADGNVRKFDSSEINKLYQILRNK